MRAVRALAHALMSTRAHTCSVRPVGPLRLAASMVPYGNECARRFACQDCLKLRPEFEFQFIDCDLIKTVHATAGHA